MHPVIDEINRAKESPRYDVLRRWAMTLRDDVQPQLDELAQIKAKAAPKAKTA